MSEPALIYNLFPPLAGTIPQWEEHLDRIAAMGFTWIFLNPILTPGLSGSLYAVKDYYGINPLFAPESGQDPEAALTHFLKEASAFFFLPWFSCAQPNPCQAPSFVGSLRAA